MKHALILRPAIVTAVILLIPLLAMTFNWNVYDPGSGYEQINWTSSDFVMMGVLIFGAGLLVELALKYLNKKYRVAAVIAIVLGLLWLWAELAVGVFTKWGS